MTAILESYTLACNACGKPKKVSRLQVDGNLAEIERTWICPDCAPGGTRSGIDAARAPTTVDTEVPGAD